jgi:predicted ATP-dependent protease
VERSDNDLAGKILEDDAQIDPDQVDANRSSALVISAYSPSSGEIPFAKARFSGLSIWSALSKRSWAYERGAFTGSDTAKPGLIETAHPGTLFLDEITTFKSKSAEQAFGGASGAQRSATG